MAYNSQGVNEFVIHVSQRPTFKMTKVGLFYHDMRHLLKNKDAQSIVNDSHSPIPQVQKKNKVYTASNIKWSGYARQFQKITGQPINRILHSVDNNILQNLPILQEDADLDEGLYGPSIPYLKGKTVWCKIQHVEPVKITSVPRNFL